jgi:TonB family protein
VSDPEEEDQLPFQRSSIAAIGQRRGWSLFGRKHAEEETEISLKAARPQRESLVSDPEEDRLPFQRSSIAAIGQRRGWSLFGRKHAEEETEISLDPSPGGPADEGPRTMLGSLASQKGPDPTAEAEREPRRRSVLSLDRPGPVEPVDETLVVGPLVAHSSIAELAGIEERRSSPFPIERGILISLVAHLLLLVLLLFGPTRIPAGSKGDLFAALQPQEKDDTPIPVIFQDALGKAQPNPKRSPLSDADRRAGGGDPARPKSEVPFIPPSQGIAGLAPGPKAPRVAGSEVPSRKGAQSEAERRPETQQPASDQKPSEFPSTSLAQQRSGPREISKLAGLDSAIREAARGTVGGEGGSPQGNPEGGFVDSGPVSFDTTWYDWGPYAAEMIRRIKLHWDVPELARLGWKGSLTVRYFILADGTVADAKIIRASGIPPFDFAAFQAIIKSSPFRPLPADLNSKREGVTVTFFYNMRPEAEEAEEAKAAKPK